MRHASTGGSTPSPGQPSTRPVRRTARQLLTLARIRTGEPTGEVPVIRGIEPSRAAWGEAITVTGDFPLGAAVRVALRFGPEVLRLTPSKPDGGRVRVTLPASPTGVQDMLVVELFVVAGRESSRPCRVVIFNGPVLRRIRRAGDTEWVLEGANFGGSAKKIKVETTGVSKARVLEASDTAIRIRAQLAERAPVRVRVGARASNALQVGGTKRGRAI